MGEIALAAALKRVVEPTPSHLGGNERGSLALDPLLWEEPLKGTLVLKG